jgi:HK97 family phage portal protein
MQILGLEIKRRTKTAQPNPALVTQVPGSGGRGWHRLFESFAGAWQRNVEVVPQSVLTYAAVYACVTLIASDIGKLCIDLVEETDDDVYEKTSNPAFSPVLSKPNHYQTRNQFMESWMVSKLTNGNAYILKGYDNRRIVTELYPLDPNRVRPLVASDGSVFYQVQSDILSGVPTGIVAPATAIIHDVMVPLYHPLMGVSPISACGLAAMQGLAIENNSTQLFQRGSQPPGILTAKVPGVISDEEVGRIQEQWEKHFEGNNAGRIAVLGGDLAYQALSISAVDAQLIEQLKWTAAEVCTAFKVPGYMIGVGAEPNGQTVEARTQQYYSQCLQTLIEHVEALLEEGLAIKDPMGIELDLDGLLRMDSAARVKAAAESMNGGGMTPNETRMRFHGLGPVVGGDAVYLQQQNYSLEALAKRDASDDPFGKAQPAQPPQAPQSGQPPPTPPPPAKATVLDVMGKAAGMFRKKAA